ncbi:transcription initiation factor IIE subunit beta-like [Paramacrobiotus metropolitanus]|uniref:transcription initiation factor IIE subunit beta-like n=1 Tax=Paramacrobiotus metropolitanus TaxID=2943436 RepID=UPI0024462142|nr:transcription initiation factor IIE subunit beta-like [Paramacrobiotus metropolitanus]XP_055347229.1 transcription initiation factor IIE subunit beta-like [Paramacrobiotus metropolitanus]
MDPSLLRERDAFKKRAMALPVVEKRKQKPTDSPYTEEPPKKQKTAPQRSEPGGQKFDYKTASAASSVKFKVLTNIVKYMRTRHQQGDDYGLALNEILDETKQYDVPAKIIAWLRNEALPVNPKIIIDADEKYRYRPSFNIRDKKSFIQLLQRYSEDGMGGIYMDDIEESLANAKEVLEEVKDQIIVIKRPADKKFVVFYKDPAVSIDIPEDVVKLWRSVNVEGMDEKKIADYLAQHNFSFIKSEQKRPMIAKKRGRQGGRTGKFVPKHNEHIADILQDYSAKGGHVGASC